MVSTTFHIANLGLTNPTFVQPHMNMHGFCNNSHCKPCGYKPYNCSIARENTWILQQFTLQTLRSQTLQLFNCTWKCMDSTTIHIANLMLTNPTVVQFHLKTHGFHNDSHCKPCAYKPYSCSIARENAWILQQFTLQTLCLQTQYSPEAQNRPEQPKTTQNRPEQPRTPQKSP